MAHSHILRLNLQFRYGKIYLLIFEANIRCIFLGIDSKREIKMYRFLTVFVIAGLCSASQINVPSDYQTIGAAVAAAVNGDTILIADGVYQGPGNRDIVIGEDKTIIIKSANGPQDCIIDCGGSAAENHRGFELNGVGCVIEGLTITGGYAVAGGAIINNKNGNTIRNCIIKDNFATNYGGGIYTNISKFKVAGCLIKGNIGGVYGGIFYLSGIAYNNSVENCTIIGNSGLGVPLRLGSNTPLKSIINTIIWDIDTSNTPYTKWSDDYVSEELFKNGCFVQYTSSPDPRFIDPDNGDYRLQSDSPCIGAGINPLYSIAGLCDMSGNPRRVGDYLDSGAYEYRSPGDINLDGLVNVEDYSKVAAGWQDDYSYGDLTSLAESWLGLNPPSHPCVFWKFDNAISSWQKDYSGNHHNAMLMGGAKIIGDDVRGSVLSLDGVDSYVTAPGFKGPLAENSISFWMKLAKREDDYNSERQTVFCYGDGATGKVWKLMLRTNYHAGIGDVSFTLSTGAEELNVPTLPIADGQWHNILIAVPSLEQMKSWYTINVYVDLVEVATLYTDNYDWNLLAGQDFLVGRNWNPESPMYLVGIIDDFVVSDEYYAHYGYSNINRIINKDCFIGKWEFEDVYNSGRESIYGYKTTLTDGLEVDYAGLYFAEPGCFITIEGYKGITGTSSRVVSMMLAPVGPGTLVSWGASDDGQGWEISIDSSGHIIVSAAGQSVITNKFLSMLDPPKYYFNLTVILPSSPEPTLGDMVILIDNQVSSFYPKVEHQVYQPINTAIGGDVMIGARRTSNVVTDFYKGAIGDLVIAKNYGSIFYPEYAELYLPLDSITGNYVMDVSPFGRNGTIHKLPEVKFDPVMGGYAEFNGGSRIIMDNNKGVPGYWQRSITGWIRTADTEGEIVCWGTKGTSGAKWIVRTSLVTGVPNDYGVLRAEVADGFIQGTTNICDGQWHHIAVVQEFAYLPFAKLYVDGRLEQFSEFMPQFVVTQTDNIYSTDVSIGGFDDDAPRYFVGDMADLRIYSRVLSDAEVYQQYCEFGNN